MNGIKSIGTGNFKVATRLQLLSIAFLPLSSLLVMAENYQKKELLKLMSSGANKRTYAYQRWRRIGQQCLRTNEQSIQNALPDVI